MLSDHVLFLAYEVIQSVLFQPSSGLLYKSLIDTGLAEGFAKMAGQESYGFNTIFSYGIISTDYIYTNLIAFQGVKRDKKSLNRITEVIDSTLAELATNGFPQDMVDAAIHQIEISSKMPGAE